MSDNGLSPHVSDASGNEECLDVATCGENTVPVHCGQMTAKMHLDKFLCPGIHQYCIELNGQLISPKQFTIDAGKDKQKDWKGSIRVGRQTLRTAIEQKTLDFYRHELYCSGKCQSRNFLQRDDSVNAVANAALFSQLPFAPDDSPSPGMSTATGTGNAIIKNEVGDLSDLVVNLDNQSPNSLPSTSDWDPVDSLMFTKPLQFWSSVSNLGLLPELTSDIMTQVDQRKAAFMTDPAARPAIADQLSQLVQVLDMSDLIRRRIHTKRLLQKAESDILANEVEELRRRADEQRKRQLEAKRKSQLFEQLFSAASSSSDNNDDSDFGEPDTKRSRGETSHVIIE